MLTAEDTPPIPSVCSDELLQRLASPKSATPERRLQPRTPFRYRFLLQPRNCEGLLGDSASPIEVFGTNLSPRGFGFYHEALLPYREVRLKAADPRLEAKGMGQLELEVILKWCRFLGPGRYQSGGRIARKLASVA